MSQYTDKEWADILDRRAGRYTGHDAWSKQQAYSLSLGRDISINKF